MDYFLSKLLHVRFKNNIYSNSYKKIMATFETFPELLDDIKYLVFNSLKNPRDLVKVFASNKYFVTEYKTKKSAELYETSLSKIKDIATMFVKDSRENIVKDLTSNQDLRKKHFDLFVNGYEGTTVISNNDEYRLYDWECSALCKDCGHFGETQLSFFNKLRFIDRIPIEDSEVFIDSVMDSLFNFEEDDTDDKIVITFQSGFQIHISHSTEENTVHLSSYYISHGGKVTKNIATYHSSLSDDCITEGLRSIRSKIPLSYVFGDITSIECTSYSTWRRAYFELECLPKYRQV